MTPIHSVEITLKHSCNHDIALRKIRKPSKPVGNYALFTDNKKHRMKVLRSQLEFGFWLVVMAICFRVLGVI